MRQKLCGTHGFSHYQVENPGIRRKKQVQGDLVRAAGQRRQALVPDIGEERLRGHADEWRGLLARENLDALHARLVGPEENSKVRIAGGIRCSELEDALRIQQSV